MSFKKRFIIQTLVLLFIIVVLLLLLIGSTVFVALMKTGEIERDRDFAEAVLPYMSNSVQVENGELILDDKLLGKVKEYGGWLQAINERGEAIYSFRTPPDVPDRYNPGELTAFWTGARPFPYLLYVFIEVKDGQQITLLYGFKDNAREMTDRIREAAAVTNDGIDMPENVAAELKRKGIWAQALDERGEEIASWNKPNGEPAQYSAQELILRTQYPERYTGRIASLYDERTNLTWIVHFPNGTDIRQIGDTMTIREIIQVLLLSFLGFALIVLVLLFLFAFWYGHRFGSPILHMYDWLHHLAQGEYAEPKDRHGHPRSKTRAGKLRRRFRLYTDMIASFAHLTETLRSNEEMRNQLERAREEWIAGVSHDLKTPLSSIMGYAHMLESESYEWTQAEVREFAGVMKEKSQYMHELIEDLNATYRLKNDAHMLSREATEMNGYIDRAVKQLTDDPQFAGAHIDFRGTSDSLYFPIDPVWFRRIIDNLLANALLHNPDGTNVRVSLETGESSGFSIRFQDDGVGMDEATAARLFDRYFRGTNTERGGKGSGLGMAISRQLVLLHGGSIQVRSAPQQGTTIVISFDNR
ncbi:Adaptive-response sensory-kinase SasA [Paenibacillus sp. CECT 9249]|uniref:sensor histidine kinase n=1 Tax=Paenibacillus sp. CECT 9249 TaxID=2845385 RepID=UPI001E3D7ED6|nr:HAMP domain-containing sensor histidine kinase [Paenibacillus sp. CECT 9249]CAH0119907.1 Adaptive-response sensory-kinase SasA [Paenibacillus sp. CECT 9249]